MLFRNNTCDHVKFEKYESLRTVYGSDHRPVILEMSIESHNSGHFDLSSTKSGVIKIELVSVQGLCHKNIAELTGMRGEGQRMRVEFCANYLQTSG